MDIFRPFMVPSLIRLHFQHLARLCFEKGRDGCSRRWRCRRRWWWWWWAERWSWCAVRFYRVAKTYASLSIMRVRCWVMKCEISRFYCWVEIISQHLGWVFQRFPSSRSADSSHVIWVNDSGGKSPCLNRSLINFGANYARCTTSCLAHFLAELRT